MKKVFFGMPLVLLAIIPGAYADKAEPIAWYEYKPLRGSYRIYGGGLGDPWEPTPGDAKIAVSLEGSAAKAIFEQLGRDVKDDCTEGMGIRIRRRAQLECLKEKAGEYSCHFGFDLKSGKSIGGILC